MLFGSACFFNNSDISINMFRVQSNLQLLGKSLIYFKATEYSFYFLFFFFPREYNFAWSDDLQKMEQPVRRSIFSAV